MSSCLDISHWTSDHTMAVTVADEQRPVEDRARDEKGPRIAPPPFDKPFADLLIRSSDGVDFLVFKWILADASPVFAGMFELAQPSKWEPGYAVRSSEDSTVVHTTASSSPPVIDVEEDSKTLQTLLTRCYPLSTVPHFACFADAKTFIVAAHTQVPDRLYLTRRLTLPTRFHGSELSRRIYLRTTLRLGQPGSGGSAALLARAGHDDLRPRTGGYRRSFLQLSPQIPLPL
ncbi:hypothetical protein C8Q77DRAFT_228751 [Trametes polyzona]|nr:hypothetical protein C8Q77DRAFT_228751 [Trametes polyzona]